MSQFTLPPIIKNVMGTALAKVYNDQTETLGKHTSNLITSFKTIYRLFNDKHPINKDLMILSIKFHDIGKCEKSWLDNKIKKNELIAVRHEVLSYMVAHEYLKNSNFTDFEKLLILIPILLHHNNYLCVGDSLNNVFSDERSTFIKNNSKKVEWLHGLNSDNIFKKIEDKVNKSKNSTIIQEIKRNIERLSKNITKEQSYVINYHSMILCAVDQMASAYWTENDIISFFNVNFKVGSANENLTPHNYQQYVIDSFDNETDIMVMDFRPGAGKTLVSENIAKKLGKCVIHGTPKNIISDDLAEKYLGDKRIHDRDFDVENDEIDLECVSIDNIRRKSKWFTSKSPILYTTPDNIFLMSQGFKRHFMFLRSLYNGIVVLDEFHDCYSDDYRRFNLFNMIDKFLYFGIKMILMSGTTPMRFVTDIFDLCESKNKKCQLISDENGKISHFINGNEINTNNIFLPCHNKGTISFFNGEPCRDIVSDFPWWNQKDYEVGYFHEVKKLIDIHVNNNESLAICFSSKKSIFQFIHMFNKFTNYNFERDYVVICSPRMTHNRYHSVIKAALNELKKGSNPKERKYKFVLCTSYTEMGVDFSVQHMIIETTFIHNLDQQLGRLNRWNEYGSNSTCTIFPAFTRYTNEELRYRNLRYGSDVNYNNLNQFYIEQGKIDFTPDWYTQKELDLHYEWFIGNTANVGWNFLYTCGVFRTAPVSKVNNGINGMYRKVDSVTVTWNGLDIDVPQYRIDANGDINITPHPILFC